MDPISRLTEYFREFPGIGPRQAKRFVYYLLTRNSGTLEELSRLILEIKKQVHICSRCYRFFNMNTLPRASSGADGASVAAVCPICSDKNRNQKVLMVVSKDADFEVIEKSHAHNGLYFILGGTIPILEKNPETRVRLRELSSRISADAGLAEIVLSLSATPDGEHTVDVLKSTIKTLLAQNQSPERHIQVTVLGRGLSTGSELEYSDSDTILNAFRNRA